MKKTAILFLLYFCGMVCMAQEPKPYFGLIPAVSQSPKTLYREFKNPFWVVNPPCDSIKLECIKGKAKVWLDEYGSWIIVPDKDTESIWIGIICQDTFIDTIQYKTREFGCNELSLRFMGYTPLIESRRCEPAIRFLSENMQQISSNFWKEKLKEYKVTHQYQGKLTSKEVLYLRFEHKLLDLYFPQDLRFKMDTCTITLYGIYDEKSKVTPIKYQRHYTNQEFELDLEIIIEKMQKGDRLQIAVQNVLRLNYAGQRNPISVYSNLDDGWGDNFGGVEQPQAIMNCLEIEFEIVK